MNKLAAREAENLTGKCYDMSPCRHMALMTSPRILAETCFPIEASGIGVFEGSWRYNGIDAFLPCNYCEINASGAERGLLYFVRELWPWACGIIGDIPRREVLLNLRPPEVRNFNPSIPFARSSE